MEKLLISNQPFPCHHTECIRQVNGQGNILKYKPDNRIGKKKDLSDFVVVGCQAALSSLETDDLLGFFHTTMSGGLQRKVWKYPEIWIKIVWLMSEDNG